MDRITQVVGVDKQNERMTRNDNKGKREEKARDEKRRGVIS